MIGDDIEVTIVDIRGDKVRLGITAPRTIPVHRKEVYEAIERQNDEASRANKQDLPALPMGQPPAATAPILKKNPNDVPPQPGVPPVPSKPANPSPSHPSEKRNPGDGKGPFQEPPASQHHNPSHTSHPSSLAG